jgi:hypothetical protein
MLTQMKTSNKLVKVVVLNRNETLPFGINNDKTINYTSNNGL